ncbi:MAG: hypothetical protein ACYTEL_14270 [Planctomycetota bacterium]
MRGDWDAAINPVWSPMYSWILGVLMRVLEPPMEWEFPIVHLANFAIYVVALVCFEYFWRQLTLYRRTRIQRESGETLINLPDWAWSVIGYLLFVVVSLHLIEIWAVTPDMLMSAFVYLAGGILVRLRMGFIGMRSFIFLGLVLGLGYLAKAVMLPIALVFLGVSLFTVENVRRAIPLGSMAMVVFALVSVPFITIVSIAQGELTFGDAGTLTYARYINGVPYPHWQGDPPGNGTPEHPSRLGTGLLNILLAESWTTPLSMNLRHPSQEPIQYLLILLTGMKDLPYDLELKLN